MPPARRRGLPTSGLMTLPARPFYNPLARALIEQRQILALNANDRQKVANALDALDHRAGAARAIPASISAFAPAIASSSTPAATTIFVACSTISGRWRGRIEDGDMADAEQRLSAARQALEQALKDGAPDQEIARLMDNLRQAMQDFLQSYMAEMAQRGLQNMPQLPHNQDTQMLSQNDLQNLLDRIENLAKLGDRDAAQELLSQLQQMLDNLQMAQQPGQMSPMDQEMLRQMDELAQMMREQQNLMDQTFQLNQGRRPDEQPGQQRAIRPRFRRRNSTA